MGWDDLWSRYRHLLMVFGGKDGLEQAISVDKDLPEGANPKNVFKAYLNTCPSQGSRTILMEESLSISLGALRAQICKRGRQ